MTVKDMSMEANNVKITANGNGLIREPASPDKKNSGAKEATVARVAVKMEMETSFVPFNAAILGLSPKVIILRSILSLTTTASSTRIPITIIKPMTVT
ncbi:hypothetical protein D1872_208840 [compost metagenome]